VLVVVAIYNDIKNNHSARNVNKLNGKFFAFGSSDVKATKSMATERACVSVNFKSNNLRWRLIRLLLDYGLFYKQVYRDSATF